MLLALLQLPLQSYSRFVKPNGLAGEEDGGGGGGGCDLLCKANTQIISLPLVQISRLSSTLCRVWQAVE